MRSILAHMNSVIDLTGDFLKIFILDGSHSLNFLIPGGGGVGGGGGEAEREAASAPEIVEQPPKEVAAVITEKLLIPLKATGAQLRYVPIYSGCTCI